jgi:cytochrome b involved in lipid metabolism
VNTQGRRNHLDNYVYKVVKGWVSLGTRRTNFSVRLPCFQRLFRLKIDITEEEIEKENKKEKKLIVVVTDADFDIKT